MLLGTREWELSANYFKEALNIKQNSADALLGYILAIENDKNLKEKVSSHLLQSTNDDPDNYIDHT